jgi:hypothetical protein
MTNSSPTPTPRPRQIHPVPAWIKEQQHLADDLTEGV